MVFSGRPVLRLAGRRVLPARDGDGEQAAECHGEPEAHDGFHRTSRRAFSVERSASCAQRLAFTSAQRLQPLNARRTTLDA
jgi:hypothetical protein